MADKGKRKSTGKSYKSDKNLLETSLGANWPVKEVENLQIFLKSPSGLQATNKSPMVKCILKNISIIREWQEAYKLNTETTAQKDETQHLRQAQQKTPTQTPSSNPADDLHKQLEKREMEIKNLNGQVSEANHAKEVLEKELKEKESKWTEAKQEWDRIVKEHGKTQQEVSSLQKKLKQTQNENLQEIILENVSKKVQSQTPRDVEDIKLSEVNELKQKDLELHKAHEMASELEKQLKNSNEEKGLLKEQLVEMKNENENVLKLERNTKDKEITELYRREKELKDKLEIKENVVAGLEKDKTSLKEKVATLEKKLDVETTDKNRWKEEKQQLKNAKSEIDALKNDKQQLTEQITAQKAGKEVEVLRHQVRDLTDRLATEMNSKLSADESALENISIGNRPMKLADDYQQFCSNVWLGAKEALDSVGTFQQKDAIALLKHVLMVSQERCTEAAKGVNTVLMQVLHKPVKGIFTVKQREDLNEPIPEPARAIFNNIGDYFRRTADKVDLRSICEEVAESVAKMFKDLEKNIIENYIAESVRLSWKMVIQRPAMTFSVEGETKKWEGEQTQELYWGSNPNNKNAVVKYYVHPKLQHGTKLMVKGRVFVD